MTRRRRRNIVTVAVVAMLMAMLGLDAYRLAQARRFNAALAGNDYVLAGGYPSDHGTFARAFRLHRNGELGKAAELYARLERVTDPGLRIGAKFNLANLYFEQSMELTRSRGPELGVPLVELAKAGYRGVLREDSRHWDAKHNLAKALAILPDLDDASSDDDIMPERSPRAPQAARAYDRLP